MQQSHDVGAGGNVEARQQQVPQVGNDLLGPPGRKVGAKCSHPAVIDVSNDD